MHTYYHNYRQLPCLKGMIELKKKLGGRREVCCQQKHPKKQNEIPHSLFFSLWWSNWILGSMGNYLKAWRGTVENTSIKSASSTVAKFMQFYRLNHATFNEDEVIITFSTMRGNGREELGLLNAKAEILNVSTVNCIKLP